MIDYAYLAEFMKQIHLLWAVVLLVLCSLASGSIVAHLITEKDFLIKYIKVFLSTALIYILVWFGSNLMFSGCPLSRAEEYFKVKAGMIEKSEYCIEDSMFYSIIIKPTESIYLSFKEE